MHEKCLHKFCFIFYNNTLGVNKRIVWIIFTRKHNNILFTVSLDLFWQVILFNVPNLYMDAVPDIGHYLGALYNLY